MKLPFLVYRYFFILRSKWLAALLLFVFISTSINAQNTDPYIVFGHTSTVSYYLNVEELLYIKNEDSSAVVQALAYDFSHQTVFLLGKEDSILTVKHINPGEILRFLSIDPLLRKFPYYSPYQFCSNSPIMAVELEGLETSNQINKTELGFGFGISLSQVKRHDKYTVDVKFNLFGFLGNSNVQTSTGVSWEKNDWNLNIAARHKGIENQAIGLSVKTNLSYKGRTDINFTQNNLILASNPDDINKIGYNKSGNRLLSFDIAPSLVTEKHVEYERSEAANAKLNQMKNEIKQEERSKWSEYTKELNKITYFTYKGEVYVYPGEHKLPETIDKGLHTFGSGAIGALKKL